MTTYRTPGVYREDLFPAPTAEMQTGVPAFLGLTEKGAPNEAERLTTWSQFEDAFGAAPTEGYLGSAVHGFFENGHRACYVMPLADWREESLQEGLNALASLDEIDLVACPDIMAVRRYEEGAPHPERVRRMQMAVLRHCDNAGDRFAVLDSLPGFDTPEMLSQRHGLVGSNGAVYYPWLDVGDRSETGAVRYVPPSGHVAGVYARTDIETGVHKAPANEVLDGVLDLERGVTSVEQEELNPAGVNCIRAFPGRGIRVWGARTLSTEPAWTYVSVRRLFLTAGRWMERNMSGIAFEPNGAKLWARIGRELTAYFMDLFRKGALKGSTAEEAFYCKCDADTNPPDVIEQGMVVTEIGLAPGSPSEFVVVRVIHGPSGVTIAGPTQPG